MNNRATIAFSGGLDSTYLLYVSLPVFKNIDYFSGVSSVHTMQVNKESKARDLILKEFKAIEKETKLNFAVVHHKDCPIYGCSIESNGLGQVAEWLNLARANLRSDTSQVLFGYIRGDDALTRGESIKHAWTYLLAGSLFNSLTPGGLQPPLSFPLEMFSKQYILDNLPSRIMRHVTWCESMNIGGDCGVCNSCKRMIGELATFSVHEPKKWTDHVLRDRYLAMKRLYNRSIGHSQSKLGLSSISNT